MYYTYTPRSKAVMAIATIVMSLSSCAFLGSPVPVIVIWIVCLAVVAVAATYGSSISPRQPQKGMTEEDEARDAITGFIATDYNYWD